MANVKISAMPAAGALTGAELIPIDQAGVNCTITLSVLRAWLLRLLGGGGGIPYFNGTDLDLSGSTRPASGHIRCSDLVFTSSLADAAADFEVDVAGNVQMRSWILQPGGWSLPNSGDLTVNDVTVAGGLFTVNSSGVCTSHDFRTSDFSFQVGVGTQLQSASISIGGGTFTVNSTGDCVCNTVAPVNGFTGSAVFTNFDFVSGVCTSAS